jgi:predicted RNA binding protein YcfA (HicA-like mRNA interferase family)
MAQALQRAGFVWVHQRGANVKLRHAEGRVAIVPMHRELADGTRAGILRQAGLGREQLVELLQGREVQRVGTAMPAFSGSDLAKVLRQRGFEAVGEKGATVKLRHPDGVSVCVPMADRLAPSTSEGILRQAGVSNADLARLVARQVERAASMGGRESPSLGRHL